jgi:hypothetical protein
VSKQSGVVGEFMGGDYPEIRLVIDIPARWNSPSSPGYDDSFRAWIGYPGQRLKLGGD